MRSYSVSIKIEAVQWHRASRRNASLSLGHFKIDQKQIRKWDSKYEILKQLNYDKQRVKRKHTNGVPVFNEEADDSLFEHIQSEPDVKSRGKFRIASSLSLVNFQAWSQYVQRRKKRLGVMMHKSTNGSQKAPTEFWLQKSCQCILPPDSLLANTSQVHAL